MPGLHPLTALALGALARLAVVAAAAACVVLPLLAVTRVGPDDREVGLGAVLVGGVLLTYVVPLLVPPRDPPGLRVTRDDAPGLWSLVADTAARVGTRVPDEVRLSADGRAGVTTRRRIRLRRTLWLGLPLLPGLDVDRLRAVVAHELAHLADHATWLDRQLERDQYFLRRLAATCAPVPLLGLAVGLYAVGWALLATPRLRRQEHEADASAARLVGAPSVGAAVVRGHEVADAWDGWVRSVAWPALRADAEPPALVADLSARLRDPNWLDPAEAGRRRERPHRLDTHPTVAQRLEALGAGDDPEADPSAPLSTTLLSDPRLLDRAARDLLPRSEPLRGWLRAERADSRRRLSARRQPPARRVQPLALPRPIREGAVAVLHLTSLVALAGAGLAALTVPFDLGHRSTLDEVRLVGALALTAVLARAAAVRLLELCTRRPA